MKKFLLAAVLAMGLGSSANALVLFSDNFDANGQALNGTPAGWTVSNGTVDIIGAGFFDFYPGNGNYIDMNGSTGDAGRITTTSAFNLVAGQAYTISFSYGSNKNSDANLNELLIKLGSFSATISNQGAIPALLTYSATFIATALDTNINLYLEGFLSDSDNGGFIVDNVQLSAVPLPAALPLFAAGLGVLGLMSMRRKRKARVLA